MLLAPEQLASFTVAAVLITLSPGPDNLMVLSIGIARGKKQGIAFGLGCALGCISHTLLAALGISALIAASPLAFSVLKVGGGAYLVYLGVQALRSPGANFKPGSSSQNQASPARKVFIKGLLANAINPKVVLFFLAFLPQFVDAGRGMVGWQTLALGLIFTLQAAVLFGLLGYFSGHVGQWLVKSPSMSKWLDRLAGSIFVALGLRLILARSH